MNNNQHRKLIETIEGVGKSITIAIIVIGICVFVAIITSCTAQRPATNYKVEYYYNRPVPVEEIDLTTK